MKKLFSALLILSLCSCKQTIVGDLSELKANSVIIALAKAGIEGHKESEGSGWSVSVESADAITALSIIEKNRILKSSHLKQESPGFMASAAERKRLMATNLARDLEQTILEFSGVESVRIHLNLKASDITSFTNKPKKQSASVLITHNRPVDKTSVKRIISGASGVDVNKIEVVLISSSDQSTTKYLAQSSIQTPDNNTHSSVVSSQPDKPAMLSNISTQVGAFKVAALESTLSKSALWLILFFSLFISSLFLLKRKMRKVKLRPVIN